jgi:hypothetical protein
MIRSQVKYFAADPQFSEVRLGSDRRGYPETAGGITPVQIISWLFTMFPREMREVMFKSDPTKDVVVPSDKVRQEALSICEQQGNLDKMISGLLGR